MKIGLFFGSFNPVHNGHLMLANYIVQTSDLDKVWFVVSPHNPLKDKKTLLGEYDRLNLINLAIENNPKLKTSDIEFKLPQPSYTIDTLTYLKDKFKNHEFILIMGSDNLATLHKWKNYKQLIANYPIIVYQRRGFTKNPFPEITTIQHIEFPFIDISSTFIREQIKKGISVRYFMPDVVWQYIEDMKFYKKV
jgi:nicotinate-nucleotide adenylyltransferase